MFINRNCFVDIWKKRIRAINSELQQTHSQEEKEALLKEKTFMNSVEMAVVVSEESGEEEKFERFGLDITQHRKDLIKLMMKVGILKNNLKIQIILCS